MAKKISIDELADAIASELATYTNDVATATSTAVTKVTKNALSKIKEHAPVRTGDYKKSLSSAIKFKSTTELKKIIYAKSPHYRVVHLLESSHVLRNGARSQAFPHFIYGQEYVDENLEKEIENQLDKL